jgi:hypothetical protein
VGGRRHPGPAQVHGANACECVAVAPLASGGVHSPTALGWRMQLMQIQVPPLVALRPEISAGKKSLKPAAARHATCAWRPKSNFICLAPVPFTSQFLVRGVGASGAAATARYISACHALDSCLPSHFFLRAHLPPTPPHNIVQ